MTLQEVVLDLNEVLFLLSGVPVRSSRVLR